MGTRIFILLYQDLSPSFAFPDPTRLNNSFMAWGPAGLPIPVPATGRPLRDSDPRPGKTGLFMPAAFIHSKKRVL